MEKNNSCGYFLLFFNDLPLFLKKEHCKASKAVVQDITEPSLLKNLMSSTVRNEPTTTPFNERNKAENVQTKQLPVAPVLEEKNLVKTELPFKRSGNLSSYLFII